MENLLLIVVNANDTSLAISHDVPAVQGLSLFLS